MSHNPLIYLIRMTEMFAEFLYLTFEMISQIDDEESRMKNLEFFLAYIEGLHSFFSDFENMDQYFENESSNALAKSAKVVELLSEIEKVVGKSNYTSQIKRISNMGHKKLTSELSQDEWRRKMINMDNKEKMLAKIEILVSKTRRELDSLKAPQIK